MRRLKLVLFAGMFLLLGLWLLGLWAGFAWTQGSAPYTEANVWDLTFVRTKAGLDDDYLRSLAKTWRANMEEAKKQGLILSYKILSAAPADRDDWNLLLMVEYKNMAALDGRTEKFDAIAAKIVGTEEQQREIAIKRFDVREILGGKLARELILK